MTTQLVTTARYLNDHRDILTAFLRMYVNVTLQLQKATPSDLAIINDAIYNATNSRLDSGTISAAFLNFNVTYDPIAPSLATYLKWAQDLDFLPRDLRTDSLYDLSLLNGILDQLGLPRVSGL